MENENKSNVEPGIHPQGVGRAVPVAEATTATLRSAASIPQSAISNPHSNAPPSNEIMIVEDSPVEAELLRRVLTQAGYRVTLAKDGVEGLRALREHPCALVISDINMPLMNGYRLCHEIKYDDTLWNIPVILLTGLSEPEDIIEAINAGADNYIVKPFIKDIVLALIHSLLRAPASRKPAEERRTEQVEYNGKPFTITSGSQQILRLLLSVYENSLSQNRDLARVQSRLNLLNENLDKEVRERTAALQESEQKFRTAIDVVLDAYIIIEGEQGTITWWNSAAEAMFGYSKQEMTGRTLHEVIVPPRFYEASQHGLAHFAQTGEGAAINKTLELAALRKDGSEFPVELSLSAMQINGKWHAIGIVRDITVRKQAEAQIDEQLDELRRWQEVTMGREMRTIELKHEVNELLGQVGQPPRYPSAESVE